jgi:predicted RNA-binding protein with PIN domain
VIFDRGVPGGRSQALSGGLVEVVFAPTGQNADRLIIERIRHARNPQGLTVVTSDREVIATAQDRGARVVRAEAFVSELGAPAVPRAAGKEDVHLSPDEVEAWLELFEEAGS